MCMLLLFIDTKGTIYLSMDIIHIPFKTNQLVDYISFFLIYYLKSSKIVQ